MNMNKSIIRSIIVSLFAFLLSINASGQDNFIVSGKVVSTSGKPIRDVSVSYTGSSESPVITDSTGGFRLETPSGEIWLNAIPVGDYKQKSIFLNSRDQVNIVLVREEEKSSYDELDYQGYVSRNRDLVSDVYYGKPGAPFENTYETLDQSLQGKVSGLYQTTMSGMPGTGTYMLLRGLNSINTLNQPLVIVDGMPLENPRIISSVVSGYSYNPFGTVDPTDLSNLTIIKDGSALTTYGLKGSNGLIIVETLKPVETNTSIDFMYKAGMSITDHYLPQLNADDYKTYAKEVLSSSAIPEEFYAELYPGLYFNNEEDEYLRYSHNMNWQNEIFKNSLVQDAYISVKGGDAIARYGLSIGYLNHDGIIKNTNFDRISTRFVGTFNVFSRLRMYVSANLVSSNATYKESAIGEQTSPILTSLHKSPQMYPFMYDQDGELLGLLDDIDELGVSNPTAVVNNYSASNSNYRFLTSFRVEGDITKRIKWNSLLGININDLRELVYMPNYGMELYYDSEAYNVSQSLNDLLFTMINDNFISYNNSFDGTHRLNLKAGFRWQSNDYQEDMGISMNSNENDQYTNLGTGDNKLRFISGNNAKWTWLSNYIAGSYILKDRYIFDAAVSADFSSRMGKDAFNTISLGGQPFGIFYNIGAAWRVSDESFMSGFNNVADLKLKVNYGTSGNDDIGNTNAYNYYTLKLFRETSGMVPTGFANNNLTYERVSSLSSGLELGVLENRLRLSASYYSSHTENMLIFERLPFYLGYEYSASNNASMSNLGFEVSLESRIIQANDFNLELGLAISSSNSMITEMPDDEIITELPGGALMINRVGEPANSFYGFDYLGVYSDATEAADAGLVNEKGIAYRAGDAHYRDLSGPAGAPDSVINEYDMVLLGSASPDLYGGVSLNMNYKRFGFYMLWQFVMGNETYNHLRYLNESMTGLTNQSSAILNRWTYEGQETEIPRSLWDDPMGNSAFSSRWIEDGSYARLKQVTISYRFTEDVLFFRNLTLFLTGSNLLSFSKYLSYDPEFSYSFDPMMQGIDYGLMPMSRTVMAGIKFGL